MERSAEIRQLLRMSAAEIQRSAGERLVVCADEAAVYERMAGDIFAEIQRAREESRTLRLILPLGPTAQYPLLAAMLREARLPLDHCWFFFMDEYADEQGKVIAADHPLSFRRQANESLWDRLRPENSLKREQIFFPNGANHAEITAELARDGGADGCFGGIGIHGHVAFNEPAVGVAESTVRKVALLEHTITLAALRAGVGGNLDAFPRQAFTLGMKEIRAARRTRLYARRIPPWDWAKTAVRLALLGRPGEDYPVTLLDPKRTTIITDAATLEPPAIIL
ncbi:MAG: hypothetical protein OXF83_05210 [Anaerolineaceae bacterium]|nr:hypothetical protein [Anaerolineaceae bacterium]